MKKITLILASMTIMALASCEDNKTEAVVAEPTKTIVVEKVIEKEVIKDVEKPKAATPKQAPAEPKKSTSISLGKEGVGISTKDGSKKTEIEIKKGGGSLNIED